MSSPVVSRGQAATRDRFRRLRHRSTTPEQAQSERELEAEIQYNIKANHPAPEKCWMPMERALASNLPSKVALIAMDRTRRGLKAQGAHAHTKVRNAVMQYP